MVEKKTDRRILKTKRALREILLYLVFEAHELTPRKVPPRFLRSCRRLPWLPRSGRSLSFCCGLRSRLRHTLLQLL